MPLNAKFFAQLRSPHIVQDGTGLMHDLAAYATMLPQSAVDSLNALTEAWESYTAKDKCLDDLAYILATAYRECGPGLFLSAEEIGRGKGKAYGLPAGQYQLIYYGRGAVQLTSLANYQKMKTRLNVDFVQHPELALEPKYSTLIMVDGMYGGVFTQKALRNYITPGKVTTYAQLQQARRIVNGMDHADEIAINALLFREALATGYDKPIAKPVSSPPRATQSPSTAKQGILAALARWYLGEKHV